MHYSSSRMSKTAKKAVLLATEFINKCGYRKKLKLFPVHNKLLEIAKNGESSNRTPFQSLRKMIDDVFE